MSGNSSKLTKIPWKAVRKFIYWLRVQFFSVKAPEVDGLSISMSPEELETKLGKRYYNGHFPLSYYYFGEDMNSRRVFYDSSKKYPWRQVHVRAFVRDNGKLEVIAHEEPAPEHHTIPHLREKEFSWERGMDILKKSLDGVGVSYTVQSKDKSSSE